MAELAGHQHVWRPPSDPDAPTLLLLHGTGADERDLLPLGQRLTDGAALLSPRGNVDENGMARWFRRLREGVFDVDDLRRRAGDLAEFVRAAASEHGFDAGNVIAVGFSNGANIAAALLLLHPDVLRGAVLLSAMLPLQPDALPDLSRTAVFMSSGRSDPMAPPEQAEALARLLTDSGASVELRWHDLGHGVGPTELEAAGSWLRKLRAATASGGGGLP
jgi:phospholipase/carboxylesterase